MKSTRRVLGYSLLRSLAHSLTRTAHSFLALHCLLRSRAPLRSFVRSLAHSLPSSWEKDFIRRRRWLISGSGRFLVTAAAVNKRWRRWRWLTSGGGGGSSGSGSGSGGGGSGEGEAAMTFYVKRSLKLRNYRILPSKPPGGFSN